ncbi:RNA polymerase sigma factor [Bacillus benzoevorans]|uniref:RNA polymerase sigma factor n=1 Tax=Bacillus benzoevorans TaxID=1456 RepID=A0A7X0HVP5_9BACI|nr:RNA polymerase sigma factor [Bacillus benzoevorans]MBB6447735.1 RNA polymerase sigma-70 factor (ECF subfamily) [Bacillus benzoevorans]
MVDFNQMYRANAKRLTYLAYMVVKDWYEAEDIVQEAFIKVYKKIDTIEDTEKIRAWLNAITVRTAIDFKRVDKRRNWASADVSLLEYSYQKSGMGKNTESEVEIRLFKEELNRSIHKLSESYQAVLLLKLEYGMKEAEIANVLQLKSTTVKTRLYRARRQLKRTIAEKYPA